MGVASTHTARVLCLVLGLLATAAGCATGLSPGDRADAGLPDGPVFPDTPSGGDSGGVDFGLLQDTATSMTSDLPPPDVPQPDLPPVAPSCGDGTPSPGEECDDGNRDNGDGCTARCVREVPCAGGAIREDTGACYLLVPQALAWADAERDCQQRGGHLVSLSDAATEQIVRAVAGQTVVWIGLFSPTAPGGPFSWIDGQSAGAGGAGWAPGQPNNATGDERCGALAPDGYADDGCLSSRAYVCELRCGNGRLDPGEECDDGNQEGGDGCTPACQREAACPAPAVADPVTGHCFEVVPTLRTWAAARDDCMARGAHLATPQSAAEQSLVEGLLAAQLPGADVWTGLVAAAANDFGWVTGEPLTWTAWDQGEPNNPGVENCGIVLQAVRHEGFGRWDNRACTRELGYVCEREQ